MVQQVNRNGKANVFTIAVFNGEIYSKVIPIKPEE